MMVPTPNAHLADLETLSGGMRTLEDAYGDLVRRLVAELNAEREISRDYADICTTQSAEISSLSRRLALLKGMGSLEAL